MKWFLAVLVGALFAHPRSLDAQIAHTIPTDARSLAMGEAGTATARGAAAIFWNPAALALSDGVSVDPFSFRKLVPDLANDVWITSGAAAGAIGGAGLGVHYSYLSYGESQSVDDTGSPLGTFNSFEYALRLGGGVDLLRLLNPESLVRFAVGGGLIVSHVDLAPEEFVDPLDSGVAKATGWHLDLASILAARMPVAMMSGDDYVEGRLAVRWMNVGDRDLVKDDPFTAFGQSLHFGAAVEAALESAVSSVSATLAADTQFFVGRFSRRQDIFNIGLELRPGIKLGDGVALFGAARTGYVDDRNRDIKDFTLGTGVGGSLSFGGLEFGSSVDYALVPAATDLAREHQFSLTAWLGF